MSLDALGIACKDIQKTIEFYNHFGLEFEASGEDHYEGLGPSGIRVMLDSYKIMKEINPNWKEPVAPGITLCFLKESADEVNELYQKVIAAGFESVKEPFDAFWGQRYASVFDPNGNQVDIFAQL